MKTYTLNLGQSIGYKHPAPDRTACHRAADGWDTFYQVWSNRKAMARSVRMQQKREPNFRDWRPLVALGDAEGH